MSRKARSINLSISERDKAQLEEIARELGMMWGDRPNISRLVEAIARRQFLVVPNNDWADTRIRALVQAVYALTDAEQIELALEIARLLLERSELSIPQRRDIERFLDNPPPAWRVDIERYIGRQQPFQLAYRDAAERLWTFTIRFAQIRLYEKRQYLECWCEETDENQDLPELVHNWTLRLDRIPEAAILQTKGQWRLHLDHIEVEMHLLGGLAFAYEAKPEDITSEWLVDSPQVRKVIRRVSSTFWFFREILRYGEDCVVVSPESVCQQFKQKLRSLCEHYNLSEG